MGLLLGLSFLVLVFLGMPIGLSIGVSSLIFLFAADLPFEMLPQMMYFAPSSRPNSAAVRSSTGPLCPRTCSRTHPWRARATGT